MSDNKEAKLIAVPIYNYGSFKVCLLQSTDTEELENKSTSRRPKIKVVSYRKKSYGFI